MVLVDQPCEYLFAVGPRYEVDDVIRAVVGWQLPRALVRAMLVVMRLKLVQHYAQVPFARGAWIGVLTIRIPLEVNTVSNSVVNFVSRSRIKKVEFAARSSRSVIRVAGLLGYPVTGRARRGAQDVDSPGAELDQEEHVDAAQQHRVDMEEVAR